MEKLTQEKLAELKLFFAENKEHIKHILSTHKVDIDNLVDLAKQFSKISDEKIKKEKIKLINEWIDLYDKYHKIIYQYRNAKWYIPTDLELNKMNELEILIKENMRKILPTKI